MKSEKANMPNSTTYREQLAQSNGRTLEENPIKESSPLLERLEFVDTPFHAVGNPEIGWKLTWGKYTFNDEPLKTLEELTDWYNKHTWEITLHLIAIGLISIEKTKDGSNQPQPNGL